MNLFLYWGGNKLSYLRLLTIITFRKLNPSYKIILVVPFRESKVIPWSTKEQSDLYDGIDYLPMAKELVDEVLSFNMESIGFCNNMAEVYKSDIVRNYLLFTRGGIWSDFDITYFKPIPKELECVDFVCKNPDVGYYSIGFLGATKGSKIYDKLFQAQKQIRSVNDYQTYGSHIFNSLTADDLCTTKNIPMNMVYHFDHNHITKIFYDICPLHKDSIGIHWYAGANITRIWENKINAENCTTFNNIISNKLKEIL